MTTSQGVLGTDARFNSPYAITVNANGYVFVSDTGNSVIKRIDPAGRVRIFSGSGTYGRTNGTSKVCRYQNLKYMDITKAEELYVIDYEELGASRLMMVNREGSAYPIIDWSLSPEGKYGASIVCNPSAHLIVIESNYIEEDGGIEGVSIGIPDGKTVVLDGFVNGGFEDGTFNGWTQTQGYWLIGSDYTYTEDEAYEIWGDMTPHFNDCEIVNDFPDLNAGGKSQIFAGNKAARVNDYRAGLTDEGAMIGNRWSTISQTVTNWNHDNICFSWNAVLEDPDSAINHGDASPKFRVQLLDETTSTVIYDVDTNVLEELLVPGGWKSNSSPHETWKYSDWQTIVLNTSLLIGHNLTLSISAYDCAWTEHGGYVYVDNVGYLKDI
jgi:hypothetical protein